MTNKLNGFKSEQKDIQNEIVSIDENAELVAYKKQHENNKALPSLEIKTDALLQRNTELSVQLISFVSNQKENQAQLLKLGINADENIQRAEDMLTKILEINIKLSNIKELAQQILINGDSEKIGIFYPVEIQQLIEKNIGEKEIIEEYRDDLTEEPPIFSKKNNILFEDVLSMLVIQNPRSIMENFREYEDQEYAENILKIAAKKHSGITLTYYDNYSHKSFAGNILKESALNAAINNPESALRNFEKYQDTEYAENIIEKIMKNSPGIALIYYDDYSHKKYANKNLEKTIRSAAINDPKSVITQFQLYQNQKYAKDIFELSLNYITKKDMRVIFDLLEKIPNQTFMKTTLDFMIEKNPGLALMHYEKYQDEKYAENMLKNAATNAAKFDPESALRHYEKYQDKKYAEDLIETAATNAAINHPKSALEYYEKYQDREYAKDILKIAATNVAKFDLISFLGNFGKYDKIDIKNIVKNVIEEDIQELLYLEFNKVDYGDMIPSSPLFEGVKNIFEGLHNIKEITIGKKKIIINPEVNLNIYSGILKTYCGNKLKYLQGEDKIDRTEVKKDYEENMRKFIKDGEKRTKKNKEKIHTTVVRAANIKSSDKNDDANGVIQDYTKHTKYYYGSISGNISDYSSDINPQSPSYIIDKFEQTVTNNPKDYHIFHLGAHGYNNGSVNIRGGDWSKEDFQRLFDIATAYPENIKIEITSCNSGFKDSNRIDNNLKNISLDSRKHSAYGGEDGSEAIFLKGLTIRNNQGEFEADFNKDGTVNHNEALLYRSLHYNMSLTPIIMNDNSDGEIIYISDISQSNSYDGDV